jgi:predicted DNA repair protein MutK
MKKLLIVLLLIGAAYGAWKYMERVQQETAKKQDKLKPSEKALKELDKEESRSK